MAFAGKVVIVTGAASGIGAATALEFVKEDAQLTLVDKNVAKLEAVATKCATVGKKPLVIKANLANQEEVCTIVERTIDAFGKLDILINNAGTSKPGNLLQGNLLDSFDAVMAVNLRAIVQLTTLATPHIIETKGNIINVCSVAGIQTPVTPILTAYCVSKAALQHFTRCAASELAPFGVRVNSISPGPVNTEILNNTGLKLNWDDFRKYTVLDRIAEPNEIADMILYLANDKARCITGSDFIVDSGMCLK